jgi:pyocin large subunit-like protein
MPIQTHNPTTPKQPHQPTERELDRDLDDSFPASDPVSSQQPATAAPPPRTDGTGQNQGILPTPTGEQKAEAEKIRRHLAADQGQRR